MKAVYSRELRSYFTGLTGCVFAAFMLLFAGIFTMVYNLNDNLEQRMTQNQQCVSNQKIQTACPYGRANRSVGQAVFLALNDG